MTHPLHEQLQADDPDARIAACRALATDPAAALLADPLFERLGDPVRAVARAASEALVSLADRAALEARLRQSLHAGPPRARFFAALVWLRTQGPDPRTLPALVGALDDPAGDVRFEAARHLVGLGASQAEVLPLLLGLVASDPRVGVRRMAALALRELAPERAESAEALLRASRDPDLEVRRAATGALAGLPDPPAAVRRRLEEARDDPDPLMRRAAGVGSPPAVAAGSEA